MADPWESGGTPPGRWLRQLYGHSFIRQTFTGQLLCVKLCSHHLLFGVTKTEIPRPVTGLTYSKGRKQADPYTQKCQVATEGSAETLHAELRGQRLFFQEGNI